MRIFIDSNIFCEDYYLRGSSFKVLLDGLNSLPGTLIIPEVVVDEVVNRYREDLIELAKKEHESLAALSRLLPDTIEIPQLVVDISYQANSYRKYLEGIIHSKGTILPYPSISHKSVVERELSRQKPFKKNGSGYRDLLIWETLKSQLIWGTERIAFLTNNVRDFGEGPLVDISLQQEILNPGHVTLFRSLRDFNGALIVPRLRMIENINLEIEASKVAIANILTWLKNNLIDLIFWDDSLGTIVAGFPIGIGRVRPVEIVTFEKYEIMEARELDSGEALMRILVNTQLEFSIDIDWEDYAHNSEVREWEGEVSEPFSFSSSHHVSHLDIVIDITVNVTNSSITSHELVSVEGDYGMYEY